MASIQTTLDRIEDATSASPEAAPSGRRLSWTLKDKRESEAALHSLTYALHRAHFDLPEALSRQKPWVNRHKNSVGKERPAPSHQPSKEYHHMETSVQTSPQNGDLPYVPPAGGESLDLAGQVSAAVQRAMAPVFHEMESTADKVASRFHRVEVKEQVKAEGIKTLGFTMRGAVGLGLATAGMFIGRAIWRSRNDHLNVAT
jgi:hypothetical protein